MKPERVEEMRRNVETVVREAEREGHTPIEHWVKTAELLHLLRCARAWAELEAFELVTIVATNERGVSIQATRGVSYTRGDILTATEAALRASRGEAAPRPEGEMARAKEGGA